MNFFKRLFQKKRDMLRERNIILEHENELLEEAMVRIKLENRAYDIENGKASNTIIKLRCELNNLHAVIRLDTKIKMEQRKQWAAENAPEVLENGFGGDDEGN